MFSRYTFIIAVLGLILTAATANGQRAGQDHVGTLIEYPVRYGQVAEISSQLDLAAEAINSESSGSGHATAFTFSASAAVDAYLLHTQLSQNWDTQSSSWLNESLVTYTRSDDGRATELLIQDWDAASESWINSTRRVYVDDEAASTSETRDESWDPAAAGGQGDWEPIQRRISTFNEQGETLVSTLELCDSDTGEYTIWNRTTNTYDGSGTRLETSLFESSTLGPLAPSLRYTFTYNSDGLMATRLYESYGRTTEEFRNAGFRHYMYDSNGERVLELDQDWDTDASDWVDDYRTMTEFTPNSASPTSIVETEQRWDTGTGAWINEERSLSTIGSDEATETEQEWSPAANGGQGDWVNVRQSISTLSDGEVIGSVDQEWNLSQGAWVNVERDTIEYDDRGVVVSSLSEEWDGASWVNSTLLTMTYEEFETHTATESDQPVAGYQLDSSYPNPFTTSSAIGFTLPETADVRLEVFDVLRYSLRQLCRPVRTV